MFTERTTTSSRPRADLYIEGNCIKTVGLDISVPSSTEIIDCANKVLSPGFVDTHHHVWQSQLKGRRADQLVLDYAYTGKLTCACRSKRIAKAEPRGIHLGILQSYNYTPEDIFWGQMGACFEMIRAGSTTVVDHAHMNYSPQHGVLSLAFLFLDPP